MVEIKISYNVESLKNIKNFNEEVLTAVDQTLNQAAIIIAGKVRDKIHKGERSGRIYRLGRKGHYRYHQASAPGEPPKSDTGNLASHTYSSHPKFLEAHVISDAAYSEALEHGTYKMAARPFMAVTVSENKEMIDQMVHSSINKVINK